MVLNLREHQFYLEGLLKHQLGDLSPQISDECGVGSENLYFKQVLVNGDAAIQGPYFEYQ